MKNIIEFLIKRAESYLEKKGLRIQIVSSESKTKEMAKEMDEYSSPIWDRHKHLSFRGDSLDEKYSYFLRMKSKEEKSISTQ